MNPGSVEEYVRCALAQDTEGALRIASRLVDEGAPILDVLLELVGAGQRAVGVRWQLNQCSVTDEHVATDVSEAVVAVLLTRQHRPEGRSVAVACPEGEWHGFPARLLAASLLAAGYDARFLGPSLPAGQLRRHLQAAPVDVVAISCTTPFSYRGVAAMAGVVRALGLTVLIGGHAITGRRAAVLGADATAADARATIDLLATEIPRSDRSGPSPARVRLDTASRYALVDAAVGELAARVPSYGPVGLAHEHDVLPDLDYILDLAEAALFVEDDSVFQDFVTWLSSVHRARELPDTTTRHVLLSLAEHSPPASPLRRVLLAGAAQLA